MGGWLSRCEGDAPASDTPAPVKIVGSDKDLLSTQLVTQLKGARHAPAACPLPREASSRRTS